MSDLRLQRMNPGENTIIGLATGLVDVSTTQWILYCKNASQQNIPLTLDPRKLYRGYTMSLVNMCILSGLQFPLTAAVKNTMTSGAERRLSDSEQISAGFVGGVISGIVCAPMELVMIQQQRFGTSLVSTPGRVMSETGVSGLFRGLAMSCGREGIFTAGMLGLGPTLKRYAIEEHGCSAATSSVVGALGGGVVVATLSHPMDTIKTCQQGDVAAKIYGSVMHTANTLLEQGSASRFFSGWSWRTARMIIQTFLFTECQARLSPVLFPHHFK
jgi:solute carrier family 25 carnitine/acylcarnitine transporter 20/29